MKTLTSVLFVLLVSAWLAGQTPDTPPAIPAPSDVAAPPADAQLTASGLASKVLTPGTGEIHPGATDKVKVHYTGWTADGSRKSSPIAALRTNPKGCLSSTSH